MLDQSEYQTPTARSCRQGMLLLILSVACCMINCRVSVSQEADQPAQSVTLLKNVTLLDGSSKPQPNVHLAFSGDTITLLTTEELGNVPSGTTIVDLSGHFITPGLIDVHVHLATDPSNQTLEKVTHGLRRILANGITSVRDMGGDGRALIYYSRQTRLGEIVGPDIFYSTILAGPRFFSDRRILAASKGAALGKTAWAHLVTEETDLNELMLQAKGIGSTGVKLYFDIDYELARRIAVSAKKAGLKTWAHWEISPSTPMQTVRAKIEVVSHCHMFDTNFSGSDEVIELKKLRSNPEIANLFTQMQRQGTILDATLAVVQPHPQSKNALRVAKLAHGFGVEIAAGSDTPGNDGLPGGQIEYRLLTKMAGMSLAEVLNSATVVNAKVIGQEKELGQLMPGKQATFLIFDVDPLKSVESWTEPRFVVKRGVIYSADNLRDVVNPVEKLSAKTLSNVISEK